MRKISRAVGIKEGGKKDAPYCEQADIFVATLFGNHGE